MNMPYDLGKTGRIAAVLLLVYCVAELAFALTSFQLFAFYDVVESGTLTEAELDQAAASVDARGLAVGVFFIATLLACFIASGMWIYRAAANAQAVVPDDARITPGWSVGWFAVPFANLVMPYRAICQHWNGLNGNRDLHGNVPGWIIVWWLSWLLGNVMSTVATRLSLNASSIDQFRTSSTLDIVSSAIAIVSALMFRHLILEMTRMSAGASPHNPRTQE